YPDVYECAKSACRQRELGDNHRAQPRCYKMCRLCDRSWTGRWRRRREYCGKRNSGTDFCQSPLDNRKISEISLSRQIRKQGKSSSFPAPKGNCSITSTKNTS